MVQFLHTIQYDYKNLPVGVHGGFMSFYKFSCVTNNSNNSYDILD